MNKDIQMQTWWKRDKGDNDKTQSLRLLIDGPLKSFGQGHLEFVTDKKEQTRRTGGFGIFEGESTKLWKE